MRASFHMEVFCRVWLWCSRYGAADDKLGPCRSVTVIQDHPCRHTGAGEVLYRRKYDVWANWVPGAPSVQTAQSQHFIVTQPDTAELTLYSLTAYGSCISCIDNASVLKCNWQGFRMKCSSAVKLWPAVYFTQTNWNVFKFLFCASLCWMFYCHWVRTSFPLSHNSVICVLA